MHSFCNKPHFNGGVCKKRRNVITIKFCLQMQKGLSVENNENIAFYCLPFEKENHFTIPIQGSATYRHRCMWCPASSESNKYDAQGFCQFNRIILLCRRIAGNIFNLKVRKHKMAFFRLVLDITFV